MNFLHFFGVSQSVQSLLAANLDRSDSLLPLCVHFIDVEAVVLASVADDVLPLALNLPGSVQVLHHWPLPSAWHIGVFEQLPMSLGSRHVLQIFPTVETQLPQSAFPN